ncbi:ATP-binding cassette domain-containing protein [Streptomyces sp. NPDC001978]|uniref:ABC transporter permease subunit n=1 Tax=Streptomyces sp. NPDC001978 TaxID=3364627 RepID=UPI0036CA9A5A
MDDALRIVIAGLGAGTAYALLALGTVIVYRGSGVVSFATGGFALVGGVTYYEVTVAREASPTVGIAAAVLAAALAAALVQLLVMRPLRRATPLTRVVATLGVLAIFQEIASELHETTRFVPSFLPSGTWVVGSIDLPQDRAIMLGITLGLGVVLQLLYSRSRFGLATTGVAENERATASLGWSPDTVAIWNWSLGGALSGLAGVLVTAVINNGVSPTSLTLSTVPALSAAVVGGFASFRLTILGGLLIGVLEALAFRYIPQPGWPSAISLIVIVVMLIVRGQAVPLRGHMSERLPAVADGRARVVGLAVAGAGVVAYLATVDGSLASALVTTMVFAALCLSMVVVLGYAGQLSLAQFALAGIGALFAVQLFARADLPLPLVFVTAPLLTGLVGLVVSIPAVRVRGVNLAILTLGLAVAISGVVLANEKYTKGPVQDGVIGADFQVSPASVFGLRVDELTHPHRYAALCVMVVAILGWMVASLRRGRAGRRLLAVRANERAAMSLGVSVASQKLFAFTVAAVLAGAAGVMITYRDVTVQFAQFDPFVSIELVLLSVLGGIGSVVGALVGAVMAPTGLIGTIIEHSVSLSGLFGLVVSFVVVANLILAPDGIAMGAMRTMRRMRRRRVAEDDSRLMAGSEDVGFRAEPKTLRLSGVGISFGGTRALNDVDLEVKPGEIVGLIGPNGAGKSTLIDVASGFCVRYSGTVEFSGKPVNGWSPARRARAGLTRSFQSMELFEDITVLDNLRVASEPRGGLSAVSDLFWPRRGTLSPAAIVAISEFGLADYLDSKPDELPQALRRLVAIARAVATSPSVLMLDEPAAGLDEASRIELSHLIIRLGRELGIGILLVEHDVELVLRTCDRIVGLNFGEVIAEGSPDSVLKDEALVSAYLGDVVEDSGESSPALRSV